MPCEFELRSIEIKEQSTQSLNVKYQFVWALMVTVLLNFTHFLIVLHRSWVLKHWLTIKEFIILLTHIVDSFVASPFALILINFCWQ
jgi:hypothetical protein